MKKILLSLFFFTLFFLVFSKDTFAYNGYPDVDIQSIHYTTTPPSGSPSNWFTLTFVNPPSGSNLYDCRVYKNGELIKQLFFRGNNFCADNGYGGSIANGDTVYVTVNNNQGQVLYQSDPNYVYTGDLGDSLIVSGHIFYDTNQNGVNEQEVNASGITVTLTGATTRTTTTNVAGDYLFLLVPSGNYSVAATIPNNYSATTPNPASVSVQGDEQIHFGFANQNPPAIASVDISQKYSDDSRNMIVIFSPAYNNTLANASQCGLFNAVTHEQIGTWGEISSLGQTGVRNLCGFESRNFDHPEWMIDDQLYIKLRNKQNGDIRAQSGNFDVPPIHPTFGDFAGGSSWLHPGKTYSNSSSFTDPDSTAWTGTVDFGDGSGAQPLTINPDKTFSFNHTYNTVAPINLITVIINDDQGTTLSRIIGNVGVFLTPEVGNPELTIDHVVYDDPTWQGTSDCPEINNVSYQPPCHTIAFYFQTNLPDLFPFTSNIDFGPIGGIQGCTINIPYGNSHLENTQNNGQICVIRLGSKELNNFSGFQFNTSQAIQVTVGNDNNYNAFVPIAVTNYTIHFSLPVLEEIANATIDEGDTFTHNGSFVESAGTSWTGTVDYGDSSGEQSIMINNDKTFALNHQYNNPGAFTLTVKITDDEGRKGQEQATITVNDSNDPPVINSLSGATINRNVTYSENGSFTDPSSNSWTATVDYGDGSGEQPLSLDGTNFSLNHQYTTVGGYTVTVTVTDDQNESDTETATVTVNQPEPVTITFNASGDTYVRSGQNDHNYGAGIFMNLQSSGSNRSIVKFDQGNMQSTIGGGAILSAKLKLTIVDNGNNWGTGRTVDLHRMITSWDEGNGTENSRGTGSGNTWNCATDSNIANQAKNCSGSTEWEMGQPNNPSVHPWNATATDTKTITNNQNGVVEYDVTSDVTSFMTGTNNYGWLFKKTNEGQNGQVSFGTRESSSIPQLVVTYQP